MVVTDGEGVVNAYWSDAKTDVPLLVNSMTGKGNLASVRLFGRELNIERPVDVGGFIIQHHPVELIKNISAGTRWYVTMLCHKLYGNEDFSMEIKTDREAFNAIDITRGGPVNYVPDVSCFPTGDRVIIYNPIGMSAIYNMTCQFNFLNATHWMLEEANHNRSAWKFRFDGFSAGLYPWYILFGWVDVDIHATFEEMEKSGNWE